MFVTASRPVSLERNRRQAARSWSFHQESVLSVARAAGVVAIDGPYLGVDDGDEFRCDCQHGGRPRLRRQVGHLPSATANGEPTVHADGPTGRVGAVDHRCPSRGSVVLEGQMIDEALAVSARRVLARANGYRP